MRKRTRTTRIQQHTCAGAVDEEEVEKEVVTTSRFMQSCKTSEGDGKQNHMDLYHWAMGDFH
jgi:hypothetical protein